MPNVRIEYNKRDVGHNGIYWNHLFSHHICMFFFFFHHFYVSARGVSSNYYARASCEVLPDCSIYGHTQLTVLIGDMKGRYSRSPSKNWMIVDETDGHPLIFCSTNFSTHFLCGHGLILIWLFSSHCMAEGSCARPCAFFTRPKCSVRHR